MGCPARLGAPQGGGLTVPLKAAVTIASSFGLSSDSSQSLSPGFGPRVEQGEWSCDQRDVYLLPVEHRLSCQMSHSCPSGAHGRVCVNVPVWWEGTQRCRENWGLRAYWKPEAKEGC